MKKSFLILTILMFVGATSIVAQEETSTQDGNSKISEVTLSCKMNCESCANKVKKQLAYTKGVKGVTTDHEKDIVTIKYRNDKTDSDKLIESLAEIDYEAKVVKPCATTKSGCGTQKTGCGGCKH